MALIAKPAGITSFGALGPVKRALRTGKVGHAGTLDKFATGLLVVLSGSYSRLASFAASGEKVYRALFRFGEETATLDPEGSVVARAPAPERAGLEAAIPSFVGLLSQRPPAFSAVHVDGKRAYERALAGEAVEPAARKVLIRRLELLSFDGRDALVEVACSSGTYIRSLARDLALACSSRAHVIALERLSIGAFDLADAVSPESFDPDRDLRAIDPASAAGMGLIVAYAEPGRVEAFRNGSLLEASDFDPAWPLSLGSDACAAVFAPGNIFLGLVEARGGRLAYRLVLPKDAREVLP
jgi:tRNA pseudouridine55 synthase